MIDHIKDGNERVVHTFTGTGETKGDRDRTGVYYYVSETGAKWTKLHTVEPSPEEILLS